MTLGFLANLFMRVLHGKPPDASKRSPLWPAVERAHKARQPCCQWCGSRNFIEVHHIEGFEENPSRELDPTNLLSLCRPPGSAYLSCHFVRGHTEVGAAHPNWKTYRVTVVADCQARQQELGADWSGV